MGQYYRIYAESGYLNGELHRCAFGTGNAGCKLMEHSWCGNPVADAISGLIYKHPIRIAWVGDYTDQQKHPEAKYAWSRIDPIDGTKCAEPIQLIGKVLVNHSNHEYIDFNEYAYVSQEGGVCIHPLPILTTLDCNGESGSDYFGVNQHMAGTWALDIISVEDKAPVDYTQIAAAFREQAAFDSLKNGRQFERRRALEFVEKLRQNVYGREFEYDEAQEEDGCI